MKQDKSNRVVKRVGAVVLGLLLAMVFHSGCKEKPPVDQYPETLSFSFRVLHQDTSGLQQMFPFLDGHGLVSGYDVDSVILLSNSQEVLFFYRQWSGRSKDWRFDGQDYDYKDGIYGGRDTIELQQRMFICFGASQVDTLDIFYKYKVNPNPVSNGEDPAMVYIIDYSKFYFNGNLVMTDSGPWSYFEIVK